MGTSYYEDAKKDRFLENMSKEFSDDEFDMLIVKFREILEDKE